MRAPAVALDLDGVVWLAETPIVGAGDAIDRLRAAGIDVVFVTNNAYPTVGEQEAKLARHGIDADGSVLTSPMAAATLVEPGQRVLVAGGPGIAEAVVAHGAVAVSYDEADAVGRPPPHAVIAGFHRDFDWERMRIAATAVRRGARLVATNDDATYPTDLGPVPGGGAIVASIATAAGVEPVVAGKPHPPMAALVRQRAGDRGVMVGDRPETDGLFAKALGWQFGLVLTGVTGSGDLPVEPAPDLVADDLAGLVDKLLINDPTAG
ncbi:MAG: HAD-IIA family hydrolase [Acidimicrobiales bacterium]